MSHHKTDWGRYEIVGPVITKQAISDEQGEVVEPAEYDERCHVNAQGNVPDTWDAYQVNPTTPMRKYVKGETLHYRFETLDEFRGIEPLEDLDNEI